MSRKIRQQICANCQYTFDPGENFCPNCGQENHSPNQPIKHYIAELIESLLHLDSKFIATISTLLKYPGKITKEYNENKRARYMPPIRLYIFISFVFFVLLQIPSIYNSNEDTIITPKNNKENSLSFDSIRTKKELPQVHNLDSNKIQDVDSTTILNFGNLKYNITNEDLEKLKTASPEQIDSTILAHMGSPGYISRTILKQIIKSYHADENFEKNFKAKILKFMSGSLFFLMPLFAFMMTGFYFRRKKNYYEYLIFSIHLHTIVFIGIGILLFFNIFINVPEEYYLFSSIGLFVYLLKAMKTNYEQSWRKTIFKGILLCSVYSILLAFTFVLVLILGWWFV
ncbi:MAG: DUF3667 domain-containing protein [Saprospiraceae bacterium]|nr:DUF3667 domain-containing protein [Saprospiraceae bacterium]